MDSLESTAVGHIDACRAVRPRATKPAAIEAGLCKDRRAKNAGREVRRRSSRVVVPGVALDRRSAGRLNQPKWPRALSLAEPLCDRHASLWSAWSRGQQDLCGAAGVVAELREDLRL